MMSAICEQYPAIPDIPETDPPPHSRCRRCFSTAFVFKLLEHSYYAKSKIC